VRVVAGTLGGRRLTAPRNTLTRPTSELVRSAIFNSLEARGLVEEQVFVDLFAGSGALGIEALSRGARHATFVESDRQAARAIEHNLDTLDLGSRATLRLTTVERWADQASHPIDVVLADPPYDWSGWEGVLARIVVFPEVVVVAEAASEIVSPGWENLAVKRHGGTVVTQLRPRGARAT
jgi:16S rRNA (guanine966-N2)-methyltransferase